MSVLQQINTILTRKYETEWGEKIQIIPRTGFSDQQIEDLVKRLPAKRIPEHMYVLLKLISGFEFFDLDITFDGIGAFGFEEILPGSVQIASDILGNFWMVDTDEKCNWGPVYFICHDPAVIIKYSDDIGEFLMQLDEYGRNGESSYLFQMTGVRTRDIWKADHGFIETGTALKSDDSVLRGFAEKLPADFIMADLRQKPNGTGFAWGKVNQKADAVVRAGNEALWGFQKPARKGLFARLFE